MGVASIAALTLAACGSSGDNTDARTDLKSDRVDLAGDRDGTGSAGSGTDALGDRDGTGSAGSGTDALGDRDGAGSAGSDGGGGSGATDGGGDSTNDGASADGAAGSGMDARRDIGLPDATETSVPPAAPTTLVAAVLDRRQTSFRLTWVAPAASYGGPVADYLVRYARVPITTVNFDDAAVTTAVPFPTDPAAVGQPDGITITKLYIETGYYFAVVAVDGFGNKSPIAATATETAARFLTNTLAAAATTEHMGYFVDGTGNFGGPAGNAFTNDARSDLIVGSFIGARAYLYLATTNGYAATPSVTFTSTATQFGIAVANAGDIDGDGLDDIAVSSPNDGNGTVRIYSRLNPPASWGAAPVTAWPATLTDAQASYVVTADPGSAGKLFGWPIATAGNFDGAGSSDLAISAQTYGATPTGRVVIVKGGTGFSSFTLPDAARTIVIDGTGGNFGSALLAMGPVLGANSTLAISSSGTNTVYAFNGVAAGPLTVANAGDSVTYAPASSYGYSFGFLGALGASPYGLAVTASTGSMVVDINLGTAATGPLLGPVGGIAAPSLRLTASVGNSWGSVNIGGGIPATTKRVSFIGGDDVPDLVLAGQADPIGKVFYIVDGNVLSSKTGTLDVNSTPRPAGVVTVPLPTDWNGNALKSSVVPDVNADGYGDFAIGESTASLAGRVAVFY